MNQKLKQGDHFPSIKLALTNGDDIIIPDAISSRYAVLVFYRGQWWIYCTQQLAEWERNFNELRELGALVYAISVDSIEEADIVSNFAPNINIAYGAYKIQSDLVGAWWNDSGSYIEPAEFILGRGGIILGSMYASGPVGRMSPADVINLIKSRESGRQWTWRKTSR